MQEIIGGLILAVGDLVGLGEMIFPVFMGLTLFGLLFIGIPVAIALAMSGFLFAYLGGEFALFNLLPIRIFGVVDNQILMAVPLFVFMGVMLERSRLAEDLLDVIGHAAGGLRGGMGLSIILVGVLMGATVGIGAGQMSRIDSTRMAVIKAAAGEGMSRAKGAVAASDAFYPFPDALLAAAEAGIVAVIQPGGSIRDADVIKAADDAGIAMVFTGMRHFRH